MEVRVTASSLLCEARIPSRYGPCNRMGDHRPVARRFLRRRVMAAFVGRTVVPSVDFDTPSVGLDVLALESCY